MAINEYEGVCGCSDCEELDAAFQFRDWEEVSRLLDKEG